MFPITRTRAKQHVQTRSNAFEHNVGESLLLSRPNLSNTVENACLCTQERDHKNIERAPSVRQKADARMLCKHTAMNKHPSARSCHRSIDDDKCSACRTSERMMPAPMIQRGASELTVESISRPTSRPLHVCELHTHLSTQKKTVVATNQTQCINLHSCASPGLCKDCTACSRRPCSCANHVQCSADMDRTNVFIVLKPWNNAIAW